MKQDGVGLHGAAPFVPQRDVQSRGFPQRVGVGGAFLGAGPQRAVHVLGIAQHQLRHAVLLHQTADFRRHHVGLAAVDDGGEPRQRTGGVGNGHAGVGIAVINGHDLHKNLLMGEMFPSIIPRFAAFRNREKGRCR